jgi:hypothetical protein
MATEREADRWRKQAETNLAQANRLLSALLWAAKELVLLTDLHTPDSFAHCPVCKVPWPCPTSLQVKSIALVFDRASQEEGEL